jgi:hypothetical protein
MAESAKDGTRTRKLLIPSPKVKKQMRPITRENFKTILKRAMTTPAQKPATR